MGDDDDRAVLDVLAHFLEDADQVLETPQVDARLRLVEDRKFGAAGQHRGDLDALQLAARERSVHLAVDVVAGAQPHLSQILAGLADEQFLAHGQTQQVDDFQSLEAHRLLEGEADAHAGAVGDAFIGDVFAVEKDAAARGLFDAGDEARQRRLAAAVRAGDDDEFSVVHFQTEIVNDLLVLAVLADAEGNVLQFQHG